MPRMWGSRCEPTPAARPGGHRLKKRTAKSSGDLRRVLDWDRLCTVGCGLLLAECRGTNATRNRLHCPASSSASCAQTTSERRDPGNNKHKPAHDAADLLIASRSQAGGSRQSQQRKSRRCGERRLSKGIVRKGYLDRFTPRQTWQRPTLPRLKTKYHRRWGVSRPSSEWDRVQPPRYNHQVG